MPIIVVGGSNKSVGKTSLVCAIIAAFPRFRWAAVKITSHRYGHALPIWEEQPVSGVLNQEPNADTARYLAAGAYRALLVTASEEALPVLEIQNALAQERDIIYESNRIIEHFVPDLHLAVMAGAETGFKLSFVPFLSTADAVIARPGAEIVLPGDAAGIPIFRLESPGQISPEMLAWLNERLIVAP